MSLLSIIADLTGLTSELREHRAVMTRIAEALERVSPPLPVQTGKSTADLAPDQFYLAESPEEYQARTSAEASLAISLGVAPWSPQFQSLISQYRADLMRAKVVVNDEGQPEDRPGLTEAEAETVIRDAFQQAKAQANER
jgi:hypothetical protein